jgi:hypothetical protein
MLFLLYFILQIFQLLEMNFKLAIKSHICLRIMIDYFGGSNVVHLVLFILDLSLLALFVHSVVSLGTHGVSLLVCLNPRIVSFNLCLSVFIYAVPFY